MLVHLSFSVEGVGAEADIAFSSHFDDASDGFAFRGADCVESIRSDEVEQQLSEIGFGLCGVARTDMLTELLVDELSHHLVERMVMTDSCHLFVRRAGLQRVPTVIFYFFYV